MENRDDLANILFAGLPQQEAEHVRSVIRQSDADLLARKRAANEPSAGEAVAGVEDGYGGDEADEQSLVS